MHFPPRLWLPVTVLLLLSAYLSAGAQTADRPAEPQPQQAITDIPSGSSSTEVTIAGPLRSFLRMAGISQKISPEDVVPLLARNVYVQGYVGWQEHGSPTEFLVLLRRYVAQSKELAALAGPTGTIHISNCEQALPLLRILGYKLRQECGQATASLVTAEAQRAFLTTDSGFPLSALEKALQHGEAFSYPYPGSQAPLIFTEGDWISIAKSRKKETQDIVDLILYHPAIARLYWAISRIDPETRDSLRQSVGLKKLLPFAADLDFYGTNISIRAGQVQVPGGAKAEKGWEELVGASPHSPAEFVPKLLAKDNGWLAAYYDSLARVAQGQQQHFAEPHRLEAFYQAFRGPDVSSDAARPAFRRAPGLLLLLTRVQWDADGQPLVPGGLDVWKQILSQKTEAKPVRAYSKRLKQMKHPDQLLEAMFSFTRLETDVSPLHMYLLFSELDSKRSTDHRLKPETLLLLAKKFDQYSDQYVAFSEFPELDDTSLTNFVSVTDSIDKIANHTLRGNAMGTFQADVGLWQILARQRQIASAEINESWQETIKPFSKVTSATQLYDAGCDSLRAVLQAAGKSNASQDQIIELIAGPHQTSPEARRIHEEVAREIRSVMDGQRLVSLDTLFALGKGLSGSPGSAAARDSLLPLAGELREFEMPRPIFTSSERSEWAAGIYNNRHTDLQMQTDLPKLLKSSPTHAQLEEARGDLAPFLRDTLVGLNYAYYAPPGAQMLRVNPLFVRSHDFSGDTVVGVEGLWRAPQLFGQGAPAGGGAHFVGSLADLAYALSDAEQDFIAPENVQALIWREAVPGLLTNAIVPRWWSVSRNELHAVALYQRAGEELLAASASNSQLLPKVMDILSDHMAPDTVFGVEQFLRAGRVKEASAQTTPADSFYLTAEFRRRFPDDNDSWGPSGRELDDLLHRNPEELSWQRLSRDFGVPHRTLASSYACELLNVRLFPASTGYASRLLAESWDSNNLYWARLADEMDIPPVALNRLVPELTRRMVEKIFATEFEDWRALLRAMREAGDELRQGKIAVLPTTRAAAGQLQVY